MKTTNKVLAIVLSVMLLISVMPFAAFAATTGVTNGAELKAAVESAASGDVIEFTADNTTYPGTSGALVIDVNGKDITIDLKGHTQYFRVSGESTIVYETALFCIHNGAKLTIEDSVGGGAMYMTYSANSPAYMFILKDNPTKNVTDTTHTSELVINGGKFVSDAPNYGGILIYQNYANATTTINDGEFETATGAKGRRDYCINDSRGEVEINGGTFTGSKSSDYMVYEGNTTDTSLTINGGEFNGTMSLDISKATTELNGGTYLTFAGDPNTAVSAYLPADQIIDSTTGEIKEVDPSTVARTNSAEFTTLAAAIASVGEGATETITLLDDCTLPSTTEITGNQKITINMNGNDITCPARVFNIRHGQLTLSGTGNLNATFTGDNAAVAVYGAATDQGSNYSVFTLNSTVTINALNGYGAMIGANSGASYGAKLQLNGTINSKYGVYINGNVAEPDVKTNAAAINITGTVIAANDECAVYAAGYAKWNIYSNANITAGSGVYIKSGTMNIYGNATITATGEKTDYKFNPSGADGTGDAVIIDSCGYPGNVPTVTIKAGSITSANGEAVASYAKQDDPLYPSADFPRVGDVIPATSTAVFSSDVSTLAVDGYETVYDAEAGGYVVEVDNHTVAKIGNVRYDTFEEAWNAAVDGDTITLVKDSAGNGLKAPQAKFNDAGLTVDFNGHTYTIDGDLVGSTGTQSQAFQLLMDNNITFQNGTIYSEKARMLVQNYSNLTLDNMVLTLNNTTTAPATVYTLSNNNGNVVIDDTVINANPINNAYAFDVCRYSSYPSVNVTVTGDSEINGNVEVSASKGDAKDGFSLTLESGSLNGDIVMDNTAKTALENTPEKVEIIKENTFSQLAPEGYKWVDNGDGTSTLEEIVANNGASLTLNDGVSLNAYLDADAYGLDASKAVVKLTYNHNADVSKEQDIRTDVIPLSEAQRYIRLGDPYSGTYKFSFKMAPAQFADDITIELYASEDAQTAAFSTTTNVKEKCDQVINLAQTNNAYANFAALCGALEDYCVASQVYFDYEAPVDPEYNNGLVTTMDAADMEVPDYSLGFATAGFSFTVVSGLEVNIFYTGSLDVTGVSIDSTKGTDLVSASTTSKGSKSCINVKGIASGNFDNLVTVNTTQGDVTLAATNIAKSIAANSNNINYVNLARALYLYSVQASAYFGC